VTPEAKAYLEVGRNATNRSSPWQIMVLCPDLKLFKLVVNVKIGHSTLFLTPTGVIRLLLSTRKWATLSLPCKTTQVCFEVFTADWKYYTAKNR